ncbi:DUF3857 domain-containing protein [Pseudopontixanthobacter vadosimaris]|uniref:DUF3857 domain-containing protein n=1 Tax=Pseudopontixanthobacter vadosimaris TaxID=2726450 RepID=UPI001475F93F
MLAIAAPVLAGETVRYERAPEWVEPQSVLSASDTKGPAEVLLVWQHRLEDGQVHSFRDRAVRIDNSDSLTSEGTLQLEWMPDKGDLFVHSLQILRDGATIDLLAEGEKFEIIRRERDLENRLLDGKLTATLAVPGLRQGDVLRMSHSVTVRDQALGKDMQAYQYLPSAPHRIGTGMMLASWPADLDVKWQAGPDVELAEPELKGGYRWLRADFPLPKRDNLPGDAPSRYSRASMVRMATYEDWRDLSRSMAPHYIAAANIARSGGASAEVSRIMAASADPLERAAMATRIVQDEVSYLLDGLDGGNYLPQDAYDTWAKRYGDCKAKSVLLTAMLRRMGIAADPVLVTTRGGDAIPELLPMPGNFDHMIVRANIGGTDYWLDGTSTATRLTNIGEVPAFHYALPLVTEGADLVPMTQRAQPYPDNIVEIQLDQSAGFDLPSIITMTNRFAGVSSANIKNFVDSADEDARRELARNMVPGTMDGGQIVSVDLDYDDDAAVGTIKVVGVAMTAFAYERGEISSDLKILTGNGQFTADRARAAWRDIPVATSGPRRQRWTIAMTLPDGGRDYRIEGEGNVDAAAANTLYRRTFRRDGAVLTVSDDATWMAGEIAAEDIPAQKQAVLALANADFRVVAPGDAKWRWDYSEDELTRRLAPAARLHDRAVAEADEDDYNPLLSRARFAATYFDYERAMADYARVLGGEPTADLHLERALAASAIGLDESRLADLRAAYDLQPDVDIGTELAVQLGAMGRTEEALDLLDALPAAQEALDTVAGSRAEILAGAGRTEEGFRIISERVAARDASAAILNEDCWFRGRFAAAIKSALNDALEICTRAVESAAHAAAPMDSRALVHYRLGNLPQALADLDEVLKLAPAQGSSRYLRGVVRLEEGDRGGKADIEAALRQWPALRDTFAEWGIEPKI